jgi:hypothetical protein
LDAAKGTLPKLNALLAFGISAFWQFHKFLCAFHNTGGQQKLLSRTRGKV